MKKLLLFLVVGVLFIPDSLVAQCVEQYNVLGSGELGRSVDMLTDLDGDGTPDYIVGAPRAGGTGQATIYSGATGTVIHTFTGENSDDDFGACVAGVGDIDLDGTPDIFVGAPSYGTSLQDNHGRGYVYSGNDFSQIGSSFRFGTSTANQKFGFSATGVDDWNGDGRSDILIGAPSPYICTQGSPCSSILEGKVYVCTFDGTNWTNPQVLQGEIAKDWFGYSIDVVRDADGDGKQDVVIGAPFNSIGLNNTGRVYVIAGQTGIEIDKFGGFVSNGKLGFAVAGIDDINGDGFGDIMVSEPGAGKVRVYSINGTLSELMILTPASSVGGFGQSIAPISDINRDGYQDFVVGDPYVGQGSFNRMITAVYVYSGNYNKSQELLCSISGPNDSEFGYSVSSVLDMSGQDKFGYMVAGAPLGNRAFFYRTIHPKTFYVTTSGDDADDGSAANPFLTIGHAIGEAIDDDTVEVADGVYSGTGNVNLSFAGKKIVVRSENGASSTTIDCQGSARAFTFTTGETAESELTGFTIANGKSIDNNGGGAIIVGATSPTIIDCIFSNCVADYPGGGAIFVWRGAVAASPLIKGCRFEGNNSPVVVFGGVAYGGDGGAIYILNAEPAIDSCVFVDNAAAQWGGAISGRDALSNTISVTNCLFDNNSAGDATYTGLGGAVYNSGNMIIDACTFYGNEADSGAATHQAGSWVNLIFSRNIVANSATASAFNCSDTPSEGFALSCNVFWGNAEGNVSGLCVCDDFAAEMTVLDPLFCDPANGDFSVSTNSPCAPANSACGLLVGAYDPTCGIALATGPTLDTPGNATSTTDHTPTFAWFAVAGATDYEIWVDNNDNFCSPEAQASNIVGTSWTVPTSLSSDWYYWRVRAFDGTDWTDWSDEWRLTVYTPNPPPSCPVLFAYDGKSFVEENPLLTACERSGYVDAVTDYYQLKTDVTPINGRVRFQLREMEDEITLLEEISLITIDHDINTQVVVTVDGKAFAYNRVVAPLSALDQNGVDQLDKLFESDGVFYSASGPGHLIITFSSYFKGDLLGFAADVKKLPCLRMKPTETDREPIELISDGFTVEYLDQNGVWIESAVVPPRSNSREEVVFIDQPDRISDDITTIRISWNDGYLTDRVYQLYPGEEPLTVNYWNIDSYNHMTSPDRVPSKGPLDGQVVELVKGDVFSFEFVVNEISGDNMTREYVIKAAGRYHPDYSIYTNLMPGRFKLYDNYPNPFNPTTLISYDLPVAGRVRLEILNVLGQTVALLVDGEESAGHKAVKWNGTNDVGQSVASGVYFYRLTAGNIVESRKMMFVK